METDAYRADWQSDSASSSKENCKLIQRIPPQRTEDGQQSLIIRKTEFDKYPEDKDKPNISERIPKEGMVTLRPFPIYMLLIDVIYTAIIALQDRLISQASAFKSREYDPIVQLSLDSILASLTSNQERDASRKQQRGRAVALNVSGVGVGWKLCKQLKHFKQASHRLRGMGTMTEAQILCFADRQFDVSHLPTGIPAEMMDMKLEENRLKSFCLDGRPAFHELCKTGQEPEALAANGFFYMQDTDRVKCAFCLGVLFNWKPEESVPEAHRLRFSTCPFLLGLDVGNKPLAKSFVIDDRLLSAPVACSEDGEPASELPVWSQSPAVRPHPDVECCYELMARPRPPVSATVATAACRSGATDNLELFARSLQSADTAARYHPMLHPASCDLDRREDSLSRSSQAVPADQLACAGFFLDAEQRTTCYWCGLQLLHWLGSDDPWIQHARWSPRCCHLLLERGHEFVLAARAVCPPYQLQKLLRHQHQGASSTGHLQTDSAAASSPAEHSPPLTFVSGSSQLIDYRIEPRCFKAREDFPPSLAVLQVGCDPDDVKTAQFLQLKGTGDDFPTYEMFLHSTLSQSRRRQQLGMSGREFYEQVQREQAQACSREPKALGEDDIDWRACKVCMDKVINVTLLDCKHLCCCSDCAKRLDACPLCRSPIRATMLVNMD